MRNRFGVVLAGLLVSGVVVSLFGCASQQVRARSSVVDYLYPNSQQVVEPSIPVLQLPVKVGIAFVPEQPLRVSGADKTWAGLGAPAVGALTEAQKSELLEKVAAHFRGLDFVKSIEVIPSAYLTEGGSFANLDQIRTMYGVDVVALVSYDQVQFTDESMLSLTYWTLVGAYVVSGEKNDTSTMLDTAVYDIASRKMLFRAPGVSKVKGKATPLNLAESLRADRVAGFDKATVNMIANLDAQLTAFRARIKEQPEEVKIVHRQGYKGGGAMGWPVSLLLLAVGGLRRRFRSRV